MTRQEKIDVLVAKTVLEIQERDGVCSPDAFVEVLSYEDHPLHDLLQWDDEIAGHSWRKHQARQLIGRVKITLADTRTPAFVHAKITRDGEAREGYLGVEVALSDKEIQAQVFEEVLAGLNGWHARLAAFETAKPIARKLREVIKLLRQQT